MKKRIIKLISMALAIIIAAFALPSCAKETVIMSYKDYTVNANYYTYWLSRFKANFLYSYSDVVDSDEYYNSVISEDGRTANQVMTDISDNAIKNYLVREYLCDVYGLKLNDAILDSIDEQLERLLTEHADGSKSVFNGIAAEYGVDYKMLRDIYVIETKSELFYEFYTENIIKPQLTDEDKESFCKSNYAKADFIYISTEFRYNIDENGNYIYDSTGSYQIPYTDEERKAQMEKIATVEATVNGENFNSLRKEYNEDPAKDVYTNGYYFFPEMQYNQTVLNAVLTMAPGEIKRIDCEYGVYFMRRMSTESDAYANEKNKDFFDDFETRLIDHIFNEMLEEELASVVINEEAKKDITIKSVKPCTHF